MRKTLSRSLRQVIHRLGIGTRDDNRRNAICLLFHRISEVESDAFGPNAQLSITSDVFEQIIAHISKAWTPISAPELANKLRANKPVPEDAVAVTFDDGFHDNWTTAYPILQKYGVPATIYVTTGFISREAYPYEFQLADWISKKPRIRFTWDKRDYQWNLSDSASREKCYEEIKAWTKRMSPPKRQQLLDRIYQHTPPSTDRELFMNWHQVRALDKSPLITIGAHTHSHPLLTNLSERSIEAELRLSKARLESEIGRPVLHFSYPYGAFSRRVKRLVRKAGYRSAVTTVLGGITMGQDIYSIPRVEVTDASLFEATDIFPLLHPW